MSFLCPRLFVCVFFVFFSRGSRCFLYVLILVVWGDWMLINVNLMLFWNEKNICVVD